MRGATHPLTQYAFMAWCSVKKKHRDNFTFTDSIMLQSLILLLAKRTNGTVISPHTDAHNFSCISLKCSSHNVSDLNKKTI
jgi:hypothetical protein